MISSRTAQTTTPTAGSSRAAARAKLGWPTRTGLGDWLMIWFAALATALVHVSVLVWVSSHIAGDAVSYAVMAAPALILLALRPGPTVRTGYRWLAVWAITLTSLVASPALLVAEAWVLRQTWCESGRSLPRPGRTRGLRGVGKRTPKRAPSDEHPPRRR